MRKRWLITLAVVACMGLAGLALAWWTDALALNGTVQTGEVNVKFTAASTNDEGNSIDPDQDRNVASKEAQIVDDKTVQFTITNGYPGYKAEGYATILNAGTIPVKVTAVNVNKPLEVDVAVSGIAVGDVINPGDSVEITTDQTVTQAAEELSKYTYTVSLEFIQWNAQ